MHNVTTADALLAELTTARNDLAHIANDGRGNQRVREIAYLATLARVAELTRLHAEALAQ